MLIHCLLPLSVLMLLSRLLLLSDLRTPCQPLKEIRKRLHTCCPNVCRPRHTELAEYNMLEVVASARGAESQLHV